MEKLKIEFSKIAAKEYKRIPRDYQSLIDRALKKLTEGFPVDCKPIKGETDVFRMRVGRYRIVFRVFDNTAVIMTMGPRGDVYK